MIAHWYNDGGTWRQTNALWYNDAGTWREMAEAWYNDGGTWRRVHRRELRRPTASSATTAFTGRSNPTYAYDADDSTHRLTYGGWVNEAVPLLAGKWGGKTGIESFTTWQTTSNTYNTLKLYISLDAFLTSGDFQDSTLTFDVSTDGTNYTQMYRLDSGSAPTGSPVYNLATNQNLSNLKVKMTLFCAGTAGNIGAPGDASVNVYDIYTIGTY
jgi:hypothetical protein